MDAVPSDSTFRIVMDVLQNHEARLHEWMEREGQKMIAEKLAEKAGEDNQPANDDGQSNAATHSSPPANDDS